jgi:hypothetical protein
VLANAVARSLAICWFSHQRRLRNRGKMFRC